MRLGNESDPVSTTHVGFDLYYHKWAPCSTSGSPPRDPGLCGLDLDTSNAPARCGMYYDGEGGAASGEVPHPRTLWRPCQGRWMQPTKEPEKCKGLSYQQRVAGVNGCHYILVPNVEHQSERPWIRWRVAAFDAGRDPALGFKSITIELANGQT
jgi:hypothetical protein